MLMPEQIQTLEKYANYLFYDAGLKPKTIQNKKQLLSALYKKHGGEILWISQYNDIHKLIIETGEQGVKKPWDRNTTRKCFSYMKHFYWWANQRAQIIPHNPMAQGFEYRRGPRKEPKVLRRDVWQRLWTSPFMKVRDVAIHILFEATGVRKSELTSLNVGDVDFRSGQRFIHIKNGKRDGYRWIPISKRYAMYMRIYVEFLKEQGMSGPECPLFPREDGKRLSGNRVHRMIRERGQKIGVHAYPHAKRHGYVTEAIEDGMPIETVQTLAGHANINQTAEYTHLSSKHLMRQIDTIGEHAYTKARNE